MRKRKFKRPLWLKVNDEKNSQATTFLNRLDWKNWWTDGNCFFGAAYIHVRHKKGKKWKKSGMDQTIHRVYCKKAVAPRLAMKDGELYWLVD